MACVRRVCARPCLLDDGRVCVCVSVCVGRAAHKLFHPLLLLRGVDAQRLPVDLAVAVRVLRRRRPLLQAALAAQRRRRGRRRGGGSRRGDRRGLRHKVEGIKDGTCEGSQQYRLKHTRTHTHKLYTSTLRTLPSVCTLCGWVGVCVRARASNWGAGCGHSDRRRDRLRCGRRCGCGCGRGCGASQDGLLFSVNFLKSEAALRLRFVSRGNTQRRCGAADKSSTHTRKCTQNRLDLCTHGGRVPRRAEAPGCRAARRCRDCRARPALQDISSQALPIHR